MKCQSCGALLEEARCVYCGMVSKEFIESGIGQHLSKEERIPARQIEAEPKTREQVVIRAALCYLFGIVGAHHFYENRIGKGLLYLFTSGLFFVGWFIDSIRVTIELVFTLVEDQNKAHTIVKFIFAFLFGVFGVHYFYEKKHGLGVLYLLTFGLFGIGWAVDVVRGIVELVQKFR